MCQPRRLLVIRYAHTPPNRTTRTSAHEQSTISIFATAHLVHGSGWGVDKKESQAKKAQDMVDMVLACHIPLPYLLSYENPTAPTGGVSCTRAARVSRSFVVRSAFEWRKEGDVHIPLRLFLASREARIQNYF